MAKRATQSTTPQATGKRRRVPSASPDAKPGSGTAGSSSAGSGTLPVTVTGSHASAQAEFSVKALNADVWAQYKHDADTVLGAFPGIVEQDAVPVMEGDDKKIDKDQVGGRQEVFAEDSRFRC